MQEPQAPQPSIWANRTIQMLLLWVLLVGFHYPHSDTYVWDDTLLIGLNPWKDNLPNWWWIWTNSLWTDIPGEHRLQWYRPLMASHIVFDQWLLGDWVQGKQWINLLWFGGMLTCLGYWLEKALQVSRTKTVWLSILIIAHPFSTELTQFIAARNDTMTLTFALLSGIVAHRGSSLPHSVAVALFAWLGLCSKESGLVWLALIFLCQPIRVKEQWKALAMAGLCWFLLKSNATLTAIPFTWDGTNLWSNLSNLTVWPVTHHHPLSPVPPTFNLIGFTILGCMGLNAKSIQQKWGLMVFITGSGLALLSIEQSHSLGFRYAWIPLLGQLIWLTTTLPSRYTSILGLLALWFGYQSIQIGIIWENNNQFWDHGYHETPNPHTACGSFMESRQTPTKALERLEQSLQTPPMDHCCAQATRYPLELNRPDVAIQMGRLALHNGCPEFPELLEPMAMAYGLQRQWEKAIETTKQYQGTPFGYKPLLEVAWEQQHGQTDALRHWTTSPEEEQQLLKQVDYLWQSIEKHQSP